MNRKINDTLAGLMAGIVFSGAVIQAGDLIFAAVWPQFAAARVDFALGLWIGVATALVLAVHLYRSIDRALDMQPGDAEKCMRKAYATRTAMILLVAGVTCYFKIGYVMAVFLGMLCLKFGAFLEPLMHKLWEKFHK